MSDLPTPLREILASLGLTMAAAILGRLLWHVRKVQHRERDFFSLHLVWELVTAVAIAFVADGVVAWLGLEGKPAIAAIVVVSYLGPGGIERFVYWAADRFGPRAGS